MATKNSLLTPDEIISIKARVKAECQRRQYNGSVSSYAGTAYDFTTVPTKNEKILADHYDKISIPLNAINNTKGFITSSQGK